MSRLQCIPEVLKTGNGIQRLRDVMCRVSFEVQYNITTTDTSCLHRSNPSSQPVKATM
jgi:hypothetical protein